MHVKILSLKTLRRNLQFMSKSIGLGYGAAIAVPPVEGKVFPVPTLVFTVAGNSKSESVINQLLEDGRLKHLLEDGSFQCKIYESVEDVLEAKGESIDPLSSVALYDNPNGNGHFHHTCGTRVGISGNLPAFASGIQWVISTTAKCNVVGCANQIFALYFRNFIETVGAGKFPWGEPKKGEAPPQNIALKGIEEVIKKLNAGPDMANSISDTTLALELPENSKISWLRVTREPITFQNSYLQQVMDALRNFAVASSNLARRNATIQNLLLLGVDLKDLSIAENYLKPPTDRFSVSRPDLHFISPEQGLFASEVDEMPGGMPEAYFVDTVYGVNEKLWDQAFKFLFSKGPLLFLVSHKWSGCYVNITQWFVKELEKKGYKDKVFIATTEDLSGLQISSEVVSYKGVNLGTIWRQFPIFETEGKLVDVVKAASAGIISLVPEFAHFGNKIWFSIFASHRAEFNAELNALLGESKTAETMKILTEVLPDSHLIVNNNSFPFVINLDSETLTIRSIDELKNLQVKHRDQMVIKIIGANSLTARSYGVLMGTGISSDNWKIWIDERIVTSQPFIVQRCLPTGIINLPVFNTKRNCAEIVTTRILLRPWEFDGQIVSVPATAVPSNTRRVHGMVGMCMSPTILV